MAVTATGVNLNPESGGAPMPAEHICIRGIVQGVGFRPTVWRLAQTYKLRGWVLNSSLGVEIFAWASTRAIDQFLQELQQTLPPLAYLETLTRTPIKTASAAPSDFTIRFSTYGQIDTGITADAASCQHCIDDIHNRANRRYRYPFTNCTHCGPRLSIVEAIPYDRGNTSMKTFTLCRQCQQEYDNPDDRRFHAQPNACPNCGPKMWLEDRQGRFVDCAQYTDEIEMAAALIRRGLIVAVKGIGGIQLACDASNEDAVRELRTRKFRRDKALALMAQGIDMVSQFATVNAAEKALLLSTASPIVVVQKSGLALAQNIAFEQNTLGFMLPYSPLHVLLMKNMTSPIVLTSGNRSEEPQVINNEDARQQLNQIADYFLLHDRPIVSRLDDSVVIISADKPRVLRRARGYTPKQLQLPEGFGNSTGILAMGADLKNTFCILKNGKAIVSQHIGDLENLKTHQEYQHNLLLYRQLYDFEPELIAFDKHPGYHSSKLGQSLAKNNLNRTVKVQHHHAHIASCMAEHGMPREAPPALGIALDGLGFGDDGTLWGGEFLLTNYTSCQRLASFNPVAMPGGSQSNIEPWRNTFAQLVATGRWQAIQKKYSQVDIVCFLQKQPLALMESMIKANINSPLSSSAGRLFDAVAAALNICRQKNNFEGQAAIALQATATSEFGAQRSHAYAFSIQQHETRLVIDWTPLWLELLEDLANAIPNTKIAARFHHSVANAVVAVVEKLLSTHVFNKVVLSGGVMQNPLLLEQINTSLTNKNICVLIPEKFPANDGGLSLGQAVIAAAQCSR